MRITVHPSDADLVLVLDDELTEARRSSVDSHMEACAACQERLERLRASLGEFGRLYRTAADAEVDAVDDSGRARLEQALRSTAATDQRPWHAAVAALVAAAPRAAALTGAVAASIGLVTWFAAGGLVGRGPSGAAASAPLGPLPVAALTPGAVSHLTAAELCAGARPSSLVADDVRQRVVADYGVTAVSEDAYELDALITPELGGTTARENLWPQPYHTPVWNAHVKDALEQYLAQLVCDNGLELPQAQRDIATDWVAAYRRHFHTEVPLRVHLEPAVDLTASLTLGPARAFR